MKTLFKKLGLIPKAVSTIENWPASVLEYCGCIKDPEFTYMLRNGIRCKTKTNDKDHRAVIKAVWLTKVYELSEDDIRDGSIVIDLGAHIGSFSLFAASRAKRVRVFAFEAVPDNFRMLLENVKINNLEATIRPFNAAVWNRTGEITVYKDPQSTVAHTVVETLFALREKERARHERAGERPSHSGREQLIVQCLSLKDVLEKNDIEICDLLKIDIEGAEYTVLASTPRDVLRRIRRIYVECDDVGGSSGRNIDLVYRLLRANGFTVSGREPFLYARQHTLN